MFIKLLLIIGVTNLMLTGLFRIRQLDRDTQLPKIFELLSKCVDGVKRFVSSTCPKGNYVWYKHITVTVDIAGDTSYVVRNGLFWSDFGLIFFLDSCWVDCLLFTWIEYRIYTRYQIYFNRSQSTDLSCLGGHEYFFIKKYVSSCVMTIDLRH